MTVSTFQATTGHGLVRATRNADEQATGPIASGTWSTTATRGAKAPHTFIEREKTHENETSCRP
jgi:hypothetical protein